MMILTDQEIEDCCTDDGSDDMAFARAVEAAVIAKLCTVEMPEPVDLANPNAENSCYGYTTEQLQSYGAAARVKALEDAAVLCERTNTYGAVLGTWIPEIATNIRKLKGTTP